MSITDENVDFLRGLRFHAAGSKKGKTKSLLFLDTTAACLIEMSEENNEVVQTLNARLIDSWQTLEARFASLENGVESNRAAESEVAAPGLFQTAPEPDHPMPGYGQLDNNHTGRGRPTLRGSVGTKGGVSGGRFLLQVAAQKATWAHLVQTCNVSDFLVESIHGGGLRGEGSRRVGIVELHNALPTVSYAEL